MFYSPAYQTVVILVVLLVFIFLLLLFYTFWTRTKKAYWSRYEDKFRKYFLPLIFDFAENATDSTEAEQLIRKLTKRSKDIGFFLELLDELSEIVNGEELDKLGWIIRHPLFLQFYSKKLFSYSIENQLLSCIYFKKSGYDDPKIVKRLVSLSKSRNIKLAYGASQTLQSSQDLSIRKRTLIRFFKRDDISDLMAGELVHLFYREGHGQHEKTTKELKSILLRKDVPNERKKIIIIYFAQQNFFEYSFFLLEYLQSLSYNEENRPLILSLIQATGAFEMIEAQEVLQHYTTVEDQQIRFASVNALSELGGEDILALICGLLSDIDFSVRKKVIEILVKHPKTGHPLLESFMYSHLKLTYQIATFKKPTPIQLDIVRKISSITTGIRILSARRLTDRQL